jgi:hypothetical protein
MAEFGENGSPPPEGALSVQSEWEELGQFWVRVLAALLRALAFPLFVGLHWGIDYLLAKVVPDGMTRALGIARVGVFLVFLCVYVQLAIEILAVFMPGIRPKVLSLQIGQIKVDIGDGSGFKK